MIKNSDDFMVFFTEMFLEKTIKDDIQKRSNEREQFEEKIVESFSKSSNPSEAFKKILFAFLNKVVEDACIIAEHSYVFLRAFKKYTISETSSKEDKRNFNALTGLAKTEIIKGFEKMFENLKYSIDEVIESEEEK